MEEAAETIGDAITYFFPGMGVTDKMYYRQRELPFKKVFFNWMDPLPGENLTSYAERYIDKIDLTKDVNLVGTSFGGIVVVEIAKRINAKKVIIISSAKNNGQYRAGLNFFKYVPLYKLMPTRKPPMNRKIISKVFGISTEKEIDYFIDMVSEFDFKYIKWCVGQMIRWKNKDLVPSIISIMGDKDLLFSTKKDNVDILIKGGTHYMIIERFGIINEHLKKILMIAH